MSTAAPPWQRLAHARDATHRPPERRGCPEARSGTSPSAVGEEPVESRWLATMTTTGRLVAAGRTLPSHGGLGMVDSCCDVEQHAAGNDACAVVASAEGVLRGPAAHGLRWAASFHLAGGTGSVQLPVVDR